MTTQISMAVIEFATNAINHSNEFAMYASYYIPSHDEPPATVVPKPPATAVPKKTWTSADRVSAIVFINHVFRSPNDREYTNFGRLFSTAGVKKGQTPKEMHDKLMCYLGNDFDALCDHITELYGKF
jgi:hypothetical protein